MKFPKHLLNQPVTWKKKVDQNPYGEPVFENHEITVRWEGRRKMVRNDKGEEVISEANVFCLVDIRAGDTLVKDGREWPVITVSEFPGPYGKIHHREVSL